MRLRLFHVDAFTRELFKGNPAAVVPLERWLPDARMQQIALENNLSETAFFVKEPGGGYHLRWFTPTEEVDFCGHATIASSFILFTELDRGATELHFRAQCGPLVVRREGDLLVMDAPNWDPKPAQVTETLVAALGGARPRELFEARDYLAVFDSEQEIVAMKPDFAALAKVPKLGVIITAPGSGEIDFVSRYFAPGAGVPEDPVTGSAHSILTPYWARRLGKTKLRARQVSARGGDLYCELRGDRVSTAGHAVKYLEGFIEVPE